ncbi:phage holin family protein [Propionibacteriaceae bacterium Y1700]|uniref:phage holin family protein n=1 Tax=Microlunatus sp. Y1700 TaxID=3418487 RepID=UPI003DA6F15B
MTIVRFLLNAAALALATWLVGGITLSGEALEEKVGVLLVIALIFGLLNAVIKPIFRFFTKPLIWLTLGLFLVVVNAVMLLLTSWVSDTLQLGWHVDGFWNAVLGSLIISVVSFVVSMFLPEKDDRRRR